MIDHNPEFAFVDRLEYPRYNTPDFEWYFISTVEEYYSQERHLIPVTFTAYYKKHSYGQDSAAIERLQNYLNRLDPNKKWYTITQYDDGILNDLSHIDVKYFSMSSGRCDYPLPLISQPYPFNFGNIVKDIKCSFVGRPTHPIRERILGMQPPHGWYIKSNHHEPQSYCSIMARSVFSLCPRGYGPNSFRIQESLQYQSIPIVISDAFNHPHNINFLQYGLVVPEKDVDLIPQLIENYDQTNIDRMRTRGTEVFEKYYTFENVKKLILQNI